MSKEDIHRVWRVYDQALKEVGFEPRMYRPSIGCYTETGETDEHGNDRTWFHAKYVRGDDEVTVQKSRESTGGDVVVRANDDIFSILDSSEAIEDNRLDEAISKIESEFS